jgi:hypothetical protein
LASAVVARDLPNNLTGHHPIIGLGVVVTNDMVVAEATAPHMAGAPQTSQARLDTPIATGTNPRSIVGDWAETREGCASPMAGLTRIGAMSLANNEFSCRFSSVTRSGATVT